MFFRFFIARTYAIFTLAAFLSCRCHCDTVSAEYDCNDYNATLNLISLPRGAECVSALTDKRYAAAYEVCKNSTCFIFKGEPPLVKYDLETFYKPENRKKMQRPFKCGDPKSLHPSLGGIVFELHKKTSSRNDFCIWAGHPSECTWNALVDYVHVMAGRGYRFVVSGPMLETPQRKCYHHASGPWLDSRMVIIGRNSPEDVVSTNPLKQLTQPFETLSWVTLVLFLFVYLLLGIGIVNRIRRRRNVSLVTALFIFTGDLEHAIKHETCPQPPRAERENDSIESGDGSTSDGTSRTVSTVHVSDSNGHLGEQRRRRISFLRYSLAINLIRVSFLFFVALFVMFYELSLVNFVFQQQNLHIKKDVDSLSPNELNKFSIMKNSALENIWNRTGKHSVQTYPCIPPVFICLSNSQLVNPHGLKYDGTNDTQIPWKRCRNALQCIDWTLNGKYGVKFTVSYELQAQNALQTIASCGTFYRI